MKSSSGESFGYWCRSAGLNSFILTGARPVFCRKLFTELEKVLNTTHKTTAANHIIVALLPTPADKLRDRMLSGYGDIAVYGISITPEKQSTR